MATMVVLHAHPDDEAIATSGTMAKAKRDGHRVVLVVATGGELGQTPADLAEGETLAHRRAGETRQSAEIIGVDRIEFLGYRDSGMEDDPRINDPETFHSADLNEAAERMATILREEQADILLAYDERGNYMHPDHIKVHHVGHAAARLAGTPLLYEATMNRDFIWNIMQQQRGAFGDDMEQAVSGGAETIETFNLGMREWHITHCVDVKEFVDLKRQSMSAHSSQIDDQSFFLQMPPEAFAAAFGQEWFIATHLERASDSPFHDDLFAPLF